MRLRLLHERGVAWPPSTAAACARAQSLRCLQFVLAANAVRDDNSILGAALTSVQASPEPFKWSYPGRGLYERAVAVLRWALTEGGCAWTPATRAGARAVITVVAEARSREAALKKAPTPKTAAQLAQEFDTSALSALLELGSA